MDFTNIVLALLFGWLSSKMAKTRGKDPVLWFFIGCLILFFAPLLLYMLPPKRGFQQNKNQESFRGTTIQVTPLESNQDPFQGDPKSKKWFYLDQYKQQRGPVSFAEVVSLYQKTVISDETYLWCEGMGEWKLVKNLKIF